LKIFFNLAIKQKNDLMKGFGGAVAVHKNPPEESGGFSLTLKTTNMNVLIPIQR
jgi:hypothetical protein